MSLVVCTGLRFSDALQQSIQQSIQEGASKRLEQLLTTNAVSSRDINKKNFLHQAAWCGFPDCVQILLSHGADANLAHKRNGCTALHLTNFCSNTETNPKHTIKLLVQAGASVNSCGNEQKCGKTPLHHAIEHQRVDSVRELIQHRATISLKPVLLSIDIANVDILRLLLISGGHCGKTRSGVHYWGTAFQRCLTLKHNKPKLWYKNMFTLLTEATVCSPVTDSDSSVSNEEMELLQYDLHNTIKCTLSSLITDYNDLAVQLLLFLVRNGYYPDTDVMYLASHALHVGYIAEYLASPASLKELCVRTLRSCLTRSGNILYGVGLLELPLQFQNMVLFRSG